MIVKILREKKQLRGNKKIVLNKLKREEKLTSDEFWLVYNSIRQKGPVVKYQNPDKWVYPVE